MGVFWATGALRIGAVFAPATSAKLVPTLRLSMIIVPSPLAWRKL